MADSELHRAPAPQTGPLLVYGVRVRVRALWRPRQQIKHSGGGSWHHTRTTSPGSERLKARQGTGTQTRAPRGPKTTPQGCPTPPPRTSAKASA